ncbi:MAG: DUF898 family protein [Paracoccaceae bacterium]
MTPDTIHAKYFGKGWPLFTLYLKTAFLTLITLGIYRFWAKTRIRKYVWSSVSADNDSFEYTGTGLEKFLGFLIAIVVLAIYLGVVQMVLFYLGLNLFVDPDEATPAQIALQGLGFSITFLAVVPLLMFAQYRARRYKMARTRWRSIRFGMEKGAWAYAFRAIGYYILVALSLGILQPLATFKLEKYMADRSWFGDAKFVQHGRWQSLYPGLKHVLYGLLVLIVGAGVGAALELMLLAGASLAVGYIWLMIGFVYYRIYAFNYLTSNKVLDGVVTFEAQSRTGFVIIQIVIGGVLSMVVLGVFGALIAGSVFFMQSEMSGGEIPVFAIAVMTALYVALLLVLGGLALVVINQPIIGHMVSNTSAFHTEHLDNIRQRVADTSADAEGFADALDIGGAI